MTVPFEMVVEQIMTATGADRAKAVRVAELNGHTPPASTVDERRRDLLEKEEQAYVARMFREFSFKVRSLSQPRASKQSPGIPDLWCVHRELPIAFWWETKRQVGGRFSADQLEFRDDCQRTHTGYGAGDRHAARTHLINLGLARVEGGALEPIHPTAPTRIP